MILTYLRPPEPLEMGGKADQHFVILDNIETFYSDTTYFSIFIWKKIQN